MKIKTISFDLWGTLLKPNPSYKQERIKFLQKYCNKTAEEIDAVFKLIKHDADDRAEKQCIQFKDEYLYKMILETLEIPCDVLTPHKYQQFCNDTFIAFPPLLMNYTLYTLIHLSVHKYKLIVASNTVMISGKTMRTVMINLGIFDFFSEFIFSDEVGYSKPHIEFFKEIHQQSATLSTCILHTGDNEICDMHGARKYGMKLHYVSNGYDSEKDFKDLILKIQ